MGERRADGWREHSSISVSAPTPGGVDPTARALTPRRPCMGRRRELTRPGGRSTVHREESPYGTDCGGGQPPVLREDLPRRGAELERQRRRNTAWKRGPGYRGRREVRIPGMATSRTEGRGRRWPDS